MSPSTLIHPRHLLPLLITALWGCHAASNGAAAAPASASGADAPGLELPAASRAHAAASEDALVVELTASALTIAGQEPIGLSGGLLAHQAAIEAALRKSTSQRALLVRADRRVEAAWVAQLDAIAREAGARSIHAALSDTGALALSAPVSSCEAQGPAPDTISELDIAATPPEPCLIAHIALSAEGAALAALPQCAGAADAPDKPLNCAAGPLSAEAIGRALREADHAATLCPQLKLSAQPGVSWADAALVLEAAGALEVALGVDAPAAPLRCGS